MWQPQSKCQASYQCTQSIIDTFSSSIIIVSLEINVLSPSLSLTNHAYIEETNKQIANFESDANRKKVIANFKFYSENPMNLQMQKMWSLLKNLCPKNKPTLPAAKRNRAGKIISGQKEMKILLAKEYKNRLRSRPVRKEFRATKIRRRKIFQMK